MNKYHKIQIRTNELLSRGSSKDLPSRLVDIFLFILILLNVTAVCLESVKSIRDNLVENDCELKALTKLNKFI